MSEHRLISLGGVKGSGKDTVGVELGRWGYATTAFAAPIKKMAAIAFPQLTREQLYGPSSKREEALDVPLQGLDPRDGSLLDRRHDSTRPEGEQDWYVGADGKTYRYWITPRLLCETIGTEWGRRLHKGIWADAAIGFCQINPGSWVLTDQRFANEVIAVKLAGGITVRLLRKFEEARAQLVHLHPSEAELFSTPDRLYDYELDNRCGLERLPGLVEALVEEIARDDAHWVTRAPDAGPMRIGL